MIIRPFCVLTLFFFPFPQIPAPFQIATNVEDRAMTEAQAISILHSESTNTPQAGFVVIRKVEPTPITLRLAKESLREARAKHLDVESDGVYVNLLRTGGFVALEFNSKTEMATRLHLVTLRETGEPSVNSENTEGELNKSDTLKLIKRSESFSNAFLSSPSSQVKQVLRVFGEARVQSLATIGEQDDFAIPERVAKLATSSEELIDLSSLNVALQTWLIRLAASNPVYAANRIATLAQAEDQLSRLSKEFFTAKKKGTDVTDLLDLDSINTRDEFTQRLQLLKELNAFLDNHFPAASNTETYRTNVSILDVPEKIGLIERGSDHCYVVMNALGLTSTWDRNATGEFVLRGVSVAGQ